MAAQPQDIVGTIYPTNRASMLTLCDQLKCTEEQLLRHAVRLGIGALVTAIGNVAEGSRPGYLVTLDAAI